MNPTNERVKFLSCAETARLVRKALKAELPGVKFSVRSRTYSGGASIDVSWTDGPTREQVDKVVERFKGADFDGMVDCKYYRDHWQMPDGSVTLARTSGAHGLDVERFQPPHPDAVMVSMGADYIHTDRRNSPEFTERVGRLYSAKTGWPIPNVYPSGGFESDFCQPVPGGTEPVARWFNRKLWKTSESEVDELEAAGQ